MRAKTLMIQGTASHVGKSVLTAALCRLFVRRGLKVAPFKAQNMSNNSFVTPEGHEIGRAQAVQATACRLSPHVDFNPVLIKPSSVDGAQLVVGGLVVGELRSRDFGRVRREYFNQVCEAYERLAHEFDLIILEGAGSPAEINLRDHDIVNMTMARHVNAPVLLVGDIERGGVFATLFGTLALLDPAERDHVKGWLINKFRGDVEILTPGVRMLEARTGIGCLGVLPHWEGLEIPQEDSLGWASWTGRPRANSPDGFGDGEILQLGVADLPYLSNFTDLDALAREPDVRLVRLDGPTDRHLDALILPGTKNTVEALRFVNGRGLAVLAHRTVERGGTVVGLCGGYQLLGRRVQDPYGIESSAREVTGLGLLEATTVFGRRKVTVQVSGRHRESGHPVAGYEVHMGRTEVQDVQPLLEVRSVSEAAWRPEGAITQDGLVIGTYVHGLFDSAPFRRFFLNRLRAARGWPPLGLTDTVSLDMALDQLAHFVETHVDVDKIEAVVHRGL